jgi:hypothetical protein
VRSLWKSSWHHDYSSPVKDQISFKACAAHKTKQWVHESVRKEQKVFAGEDGLMMAQEVVQPCSSWVQGKCDVDNRDLDGIERTDV